MKKTIGVLLLSGWVTALVAHPIYTLLTGGALNTYDLIILGILSFFGILVSAALLLIIPLAAVDLIKGDL